MDQHPGDYIEWPSDDQLPMGMSQIMSWPAPDYQRIERKRRQPQHSDWHIAPQHYLWPALYGAQVTAQSTKAIAE